MRVCLRALLWPHTTDVTWVTAVTSVCALVRARSSRAVLRTECSPASGPWRAAELCGAVSTRACPEGASDWAPVEGR